MEVVGLVGMCMLHAAWLFRYYLVTMVSIADEMKKAKQKTKTTKNPVSKKPVSAKTKKRAILSAARDEVNNVNVMSCINDQCHVSIIILMYLCTE